MLSRLGQRSESKLQARGNARLAVFMVENVAPGSPARSWEGIETTRRWEIPLSHWSPARTDYPQTPRSAGH
jgi:hypothetical protein